MANESELYVFRTSLTAIEAAKALRFSMDESELDFMFKISARGSRPIIGNADDHACRLMRRPGWFSNDFAGVFTAAIFEEQQCTRLDGRFEKIQFGLPMGSRNSKAGSIASIKFAIALLIGFQAYNIFGALTDADHPLLNPAAVFAALFLAAMCAYYSVSIRAKKRQKEFVLRHVKTVLNASLARQELTD